MKIGVIADTHVPRSQRQLPAALTRAFAGVDIILHAGDVCTLDVLRSLQNQFALTMAVHGERDDDDVQHYLESQQVVEFASRRVGLIHGHQMTATSWWQRLWMGADRLEAAVHAGLVGAFEGVDCIVYGHTHQPHVEMHGGVLYFNPGPAAPVDGRRPSVGLLDIGEESLTGRIIYLDEV
jgi:uncharacterized protein